ncbi:MAG: DNRLRE domain-containing protein [bacterium]
MTQLMMMDVRKDHKNGLRFFFIVIFSAFLLCFSSLTLAQNPHTFTPTDDGFVRSNRPTKLYGHTFELRVRKSSSADFNTYIKFNVTGLAGPVQSAKLRVTVIDASVQGGQVYSVSNNWNENILTFENAPKISGTSLDAAGSVQLNQAVEFDVTSAINGNGVYSFGINNKTRDLANYSSKEGVAAPELVVVAGNSGGGAIPPVISGFSPQSGPVGTAVTVSGSHFTGAASVTFNGTAASFTVRSATQISASVPQGATTGKIVVTTANGVGASSQDFVVNSGAPSTVTFIPTDDSFVRSKKPTNRYGSHDVLRVRQPHSDDVVSYLKFNVTGLSGPVASAKLRLHVTDGSVDGGRIFHASNFFKGSNVAWNEKDMTYQTAPVLSGPALVSIGNILVNEVVEIDVTSALSGTGVISFAIRNDANDLATYSSKEGLFSPELVVQTGGGNGNGNGNGNGSNNIPVISGFTPVNGNIGTEITLVGSHFTGATSVTFNGTPATVFAVDSDLQVRATVPAGASSGKIAVTTNDSTGTSRSDFIVLAPPGIASFTPTSGAPGTVVTVSGNNFTSVTAVSFNGTPASAFVVRSGNQLQATVPAGAATGKIRLSNSIGTAVSVSNFTVSDAPSSIALTPSDDSFVRSNRAARIYGDSGELRVRKTASADHITYLKFSVNGTGGVVRSAKLQLWVIEAGAQGGSVYTVSNNLKGSSSAWSERNLNYENAPDVTGTALANMGAVGLNQTVEFDVTTAVTGDGVYSFAIKNKSSDLTAYSSKEGSQAAQLVIETGGNSSAPFISRFSPTSGYAGTLVTIVGNNFTGVTGVSFNGISAIAYVVDSATQIRATVPAGAGSGKVTVTNGDGAGISSGNFGLLQIPRVTSFSPTNGPPGTQVTISGTNFVSINQVAFNGASSDNFNVDSDTQIRATVPASATTGSVSVRNAAGTAVSGDFTVTTPAGSGSGTFTFSVIGDAFVRSTRATKNYGHSQELRVRKTSSSDYNTYLKFNVSGVSGNVSYAAIRLYVTDASSEGGEVYSVSNNYQGSNQPWDEDNLIYENAPNLSGSPLSALGAVNLGQTVEFEVTDAINGNGVISFAISSDNGNLANYSSKEGQKSPELVVNTGSRPSSNNAPTITSFSPTRGTVGRVVTIRGTNFKGDPVGGGNSGGLVRIMPLGNSITRGLHGSTDNAGYRNDLAELLDSKRIKFNFVGSRDDGVGFDNDHEGHGGIRADQVLAALDNWLNVNPPDIVLLHIGTNDISNGDGAQSTANEIGRILDTIRAFDANVITILSSVIPRRDSKNSENDALNNLISDLFRQKRKAGYRLYYAGNNEAFTANSTWANAYIADIVHPNDRGYAVMAGVWFDVLRGILNSSDQLQVAFNGVAATNIIRDSSTKLRAYVPLGASTGKISVTTKQGAGFSSRNFVVTGGATATLAFAEPTIGKNWLPGSTHSLTWTASSGVKRVTLDYSTDYGQNWQPISQNIPNTGRVSWQLPASLQGSGLIRVSSTHESGDVSESVAKFTMAKPEASLNLPNLGQMKRAAFGQTAIGTSASPDINRDGNVDIFDILEFLDSNIDEHFYTRARSGAVELQKDAFVKINVSDIQKTTGSFVTAPVWVQSDAPIRGFQLQLRLDGAATAILPPVLQLQNHNVMLSWSISENTIDIIGYVKREESAFNMKGALLKVFAELQTTTPVEIQFEVTKAMFVTKDHKALAVEIEQQATSTKQIPEEFQLSQNYPNPFNITTRINFSLPEKSDVSLRIYNLKGELVRTLVQGKKEPGQYRILWDGKNDRGRIVASGLYIYRVKAGRWEDSKKLTLLK